MAANQPLLCEAPAADPARLAVARPRLPPAEAIFPYLQRIDEARWYSNFGPLLTELEDRLAARFAAGTRVITVANATQALSVTKSARLLANSKGTGKAVRTLDPGMMLYPTGNKDGLMWEVEDELGNKGWGNSTMTELAR